MGIGTSIGWMGCFAIRIVEARLAARKGQAPGSWRDQGTEGFFKTKVPSRIADTEARQYRCIKRSNEGNVALFSIYERSRRNVLPAIGRNFAALLFRQSKGHAEAVGGLQGKDPCLEVVGELHLKSS